MNFQTMHKQRKFILIAALIGAIAVFLPWVSVNIGFGYGTVTANGFRGGGIFVFLCLVGCAVVAFLGDQTKPLDKTFWIIALAASAIAAVIMIINFFRAMDYLSAIGFGYYITLLGSIATVAATYMFRSPGDSIQSGFDSLKSDVNKNTSNTGGPTTGA